MLQGRLIAELLLLGACSGFLAGLLGIGGGLMMVPFMCWVLQSKGFPEEHVLKTAIATSLAAICFTSISSMRAHHARGAVRWDIVRRLAPGILAGSLLGAQVAGALPTKVLGFVFAFFVGVSATQLWLDRKPKATRELPGPVGQFGAGTVIGTVSSLVGAGGGFISVPFMVACNVSMHQAVATSAALGFPLALAGTAGYIWAGQGLHDLPPGAVGFLYLPALITVALASVTLAPIGAHMAHRLNVRHLKRVFACMLYVIALWMLVRTLG